MTTGPHEPASGGRYHEQPNRGSPGGGGTGSRGPGGRRPTEPEANELAEFRKSVAALTASVDVLRTVITDSDVRPTEGVTAVPAKPQRGRLPTPTNSSDPALTRAERRVKIATGGLAFFVALSSALGALLASAWSYIEGYGDERAASAVQAEHAKMQIETQAQRIEDLLQNQKSMQQTSENLNEELAKVRRSRTLLELRAKYLDDVRLALVQKRRVPDKPPELEQAEKQADKDEANHP